MFFNSTRIKCSQHQAEVKVFAVMIAPVACAKLLKGRRDICGPEEFTKIADEISVRWFRKVVLVRLTGWT
jgi:hypothetical protein